MAKLDGSWGSRLKHALLVCGLGTGLVIVVLLVGEIVRPYRSPIRPRSDPLATAPPVELSTSLVQTVAPRPVRTATTPPAYRTLASSDERRASLAPYSGNLVVTAPPEELDKRWSAESHDDEWSTNTRAFVEAMLESVGGKPASVSTVDCKETICKLSFAGEDMTSVYRMGRRMVKDKVPFQTSVLQGDGGLRFVAYLAREDHEQEVFAR